jgi:hypothetical protein
VFSVLSHLAVGARVLMLSHGVARLYADRFLIANWIWCHTPVNIAHSPSRVWLWSFTRARIGDLRRVSPEDYACEARA